MKTQSDIILIYLSWDDAQGPVMEKTYPENLSNQKHIERVGMHLFNASRLIYGKDPINQAEHILLRVNYIDKSCFVYFDSVEDKNMRAKKKEFMLSLIAPYINFYQSIEIQKIVKDLSNQIKASRIPDFENYWKKCLKILSTTKMIY